MKHIKQFSYLTLVILVTFLILACSNQSTSKLQFTDQHSIAAGLSHIVALKKDGTVMCHIRTTATTTNVHREDECFVSKWNDIVSIAAGEVFTAGLRSDGMIMITGNDLDQEKVATWKDIVEIEAIGQTLVGLKSDGTVVSMTSSPDLIWTSENNDFNQELSSWTDITGIFAGDNVLNGQKSDGTILTTWGEDDTSNWKDIKDIATGYFFRVGLTNKGECFYSGSYEKIKSTLLECTEIQDLSAGYYDVVGLKKDGTVVVATMVENDASWLDLSSWRDIIEIVDAWGTVLGLKKDGTLISHGLTLEDKDIISNWTNIGAPD